MKNFIKQEKWNLLFVGWVTFLIPLFFFRADNFEFNAILSSVLQSLVFSIELYVVSLFFSGVYKRIFFILIFTLYYLPGIITSSALIIDESLLTGDDFWFLFQSYPKADSEYVGNYLTWQLGLNVLIYTLVSIFLLTRKITSIRLKAKEKVLIMTGCVLLACFSFTHRETTYTVNFYNALYNYYHDLRLYDTNIKNRLVVRNNISIQLQDGRSKTFVLIIGESLSRQHMSLYGYKRNTNPLLKRIENELWRFNDISSPSMQTDPCLKKVLTFANVDFPHYYYQKPSVIDLFKALDFRTYWIKNAYDIPSGIYKNISKTSDEYIDLNFVKQDASVLSPLQTILEKKNEPNQFIIIHLTGSHLPYRMRYPKSFDVFKDKSTIQSVVKEQLTLEQIQRINEYDNTVLYNDSVIYSIIELVKRKGNDAYILYFPDHGEEVFDTDIHSGRGVNYVTSNMFQIPLIVWLSDSFRAKTTQVVQLDRPYSTEDIIHSILDLSTIRYPDYDSTRSLFSKSFQARPRYVNGKVYHFLKHIGPPTNLYSSNRQELIISPL